MLKTNNTIYRILQAVPLLAACLLTLSACSKDSTLSASDSDQQQDKTPIELTVGIAGEGGAETRGVTRTVTNATRYGKTAAAFKDNTSLYMVMKSEKTTTPTSTRYTRTMGTVTGQATGTESAVNFTDGYKRYYEDACTASARDGKLSIYAACVPGQANALSINGSTIYNSNIWSETVENTTIAWPLSGSVTTQDANFIAQQDLCFSNNISNLESTENRIAFNTKTNKFTTDQSETGNNPERGGRMIFYHALTKVTFKISKGNGFDETTPFKFPDANNDNIDDTNIILNGFNTTGTFNIVDGKFTAVQSTTSVNKFAEEAKNTAATNDEPGYAYVLTALLVPGTDLYGSDKESLENIRFTIDNNEYHLTKAQLCTALASAKLSDGSTPALETPTSTEQQLMRAGVHYIFKMTVGKTKVDQLTAAVVDWEKVSATVNPSNARVNVSLLDASGMTGSERITGTPATFDLYKSKVSSPAIADNSFENYVWATGYTNEGNKAVLTWVPDNDATDGDDSHYTTNWLWDNNTEFFHFRAVSPKTTEEWKITTTESKDYISLTSGTSYTDVQWGAPFLATTGKLTYSTNTGFDNEQNHGQANESHQIYKAIGATNDVIKLVMFHMMSDVTIEIKTTSGSDAVTLKDETNPSNPKYTTLSLTNIHPTGTVQMGDGLVTPTGTATTVNSGNIETYDDTEKKYTWHYGFVPQSLKGSNDNATTDDVMLTITTPDNNQYIIDMKNIVASTVGNNLIANPYGNSKIVNRWYPNYKYTYTFTLKKTGIANITATLADWETVTAGDDNVQIK